MAKFNYSSGLPRVVKQIAFLPGRQTKMFGPRYHDVGKVVADSADAGYLPEFGEFVEIKGSDAKGLLIDEVDADTAKADLAFVVRDIVGAQTLGDGIVAGAKANVPLTLAIQTAGQKGQYVAILGGGTPSVGGTVHVGLGTGATVAGVVYASAQGLQGVDSIETDWVFASSRFAPLNATNVYAVMVEYKG
jgi:hypothetical protein